MGGVSAARRGAGRPASRCGRAANLAPAGGCKPLCLTARPDARLGRRQRVEADYGLADVLCSRRNPGGRSRCASDRQLEPLGAGCAPPVHRTAHAQQSGGRTEKLFPSHSDEVAKRGGVTSNGVCWRIGGNTTAGGRIPECSCVSGIANERQQSSRPLILTREALEQLLEAVLDTSFDTASEEACWT
jgi:hypothetical protein